MAKADDKQVTQRVFKVINASQAADKATNEKSLHFCEDNHPHKEEWASFGEDAGKRELSHSDGRNVNWYNQYGNSA